MASQQNAVRIAGVLRSHGFPAWLVGGCVRDLVLGRTPKDFDLTTNAEPAQLLQRFPNAELVGAQFGVVMVTGVEVATFRSDLEYRDGRRPEQVRFEKDVR